MTGAMQFLTAAKREVAAPRRGDDDAATRRTTAPIPQVAAPRRAMMTVGPDIIYDKFRKLLPLAGAMMTT